MANPDLYLQQIEQLKQQVDQVKDATNDMRARRQALSSEPVVTQGEHLRNSLSRFLPGHLMPKNLGKLGQSVWPFYYDVSFDLSTTTDWPDLTSNTRQVRSFQVTQEAAFIFMAVSRHANDYSAGGDLGPLTIEFRDRQSSRFFNDSPIPIQMIATKGFWTILPTGMILLPNAFFDCTMATSLDDGVVQNTEPASTGKNKFTFFGYRCRVDDAKNVLSTVFG
jgi:hypothetical protein